MQLKSSRELLIASGADLEIRAPVTAGAGMTPSQAGFAGAILGLFSKGEQWEVLEKFRVGQLDWAIGKSVCPDAWLVKK